MSITWNSSNSLFLKSDSHIGLYLLVIMPGKAAELYKKLFEKEQQQKLCKEAVKGIWFFFYSKD